jgi:putative glutamine amidotransferase
MRPKIGITTNYVDRKECKDGKRQRGLENQDLLMSTVDYSDLIKAAGGLPILIPILDFKDQALIQEYLETIDGLILTGGPDIHPSLYGQPPKEGLKETVIKRDRFELQLLKTALATNTPVLGICKGIQLINVFFGGQLYQDLSNERESTINHRGSFKDKTKVIHEVTFEEGSILHQVFHKRTLAVNSFHHQGISILGENLTPIAFSEDGLIEGVIYDKKPMILGVQWHPEMMFIPYEEQLHLIKHFINEAKSSS